MDKTIIIEENSNTNKFFENIKFDKEFLIKTINETTNTFLFLASHKIKQVKGYKYKNKSIYEYKLKLPNQNYRLAYIFENDKIIVFFISDKIIKMEFTKAISKFKEVKKI